MRTLLKIVAALILILAIVTIHLGIVYVLPFPWNKINVIISAIVLSLLIFESGVSVWVTFFVHLFVEVFAPQPFGIIIFSSTIAMLCVYWLYRYLFTNRSLYSVIVVTAVALIFYRVLYTTLLMFLSLWRTDIDIPFGNLSILYTWELILTTLFSAFLYGLLLMLSTSLRKDKPKKLLWTKV